MFFESHEGGRAQRRQPSARSADRSFDAAYATIVKADMSSLIGAGVLYWLSVGPVRGFAFYLGATTVLDLVVRLLLPATRRRGPVPGPSQGEHPRRFGIPMDDLPERRGPDTGLRTGARRFRQRRHRGGRGLT